ncbi:MAG: hypothetical protein JWR20_1158 [Marmoricola sp.]|nr:hypothetical protein [Marmoricola sp.]
MLILLPPSEGKSVPRRGAPLDLAGLSFPELTAPRLQVVATLEALARDRPEEAARVLGLGPSQADAVARDARLTALPTARADAVYTGVLYDHLDVAGLDPAARRRASRWLAVQSALLGLVRPGDRIPSYRLSGDTALPGLGTVSGLWRTALDPVVREAAGTGLVVDLRSSAYASFWRPGADVAPRVAAVRVLQQVGGRRTVVSHFNKATKGRLTRALLEHGVAPRTPAALASAWRDLGWTVEEAGAGRHGSALDVVVEEL